MDYDEADEAVKRFLELGEMMHTAYEVIIITLEGLPIPIQLPHWSPQEGTKPDIPGLERARSLTRDEPVPVEAKVLFETILLDWLTAFELGCAIRLAGPAPWRLDAMEGALERAAVAMQAVLPLLDPDEDDESSEDDE